MEVQYFFGTVPNQRINLGEWGGYRARLNIAAVPVIYQTGGVNMEYLLRSKNCQLPYELRAWEDEFDRQVASHPASFSGLSK